MARHRSSSASMLVIAILLVALAATSIGAWYMYQRPAPQAAEVAADATEYLAVGDPHPASFRPQDIPPWLWGHVGIIAALQVIAVLLAAIRAGRSRITAGEAATIQFLVEVPMYLGLFGTLLGVCLTQFLTGTLVAPLAYLTTMWGILLHVFGKLMVLLPLSISAMQEE